MTEEIDTLIVRHLPAEFSEEEQDDFLKQFGAVAVRSMGHRGRLKHTAFATFPNHEEAKKAIGRLHQLDVLGHTLIAEFAKTNQKSQFPCMIEKSDITSKLKNEEVSVEKTSNTTGKNRHDIANKLNSISSKWNFKYSFDPQLQYVYPPPTVTILTNIANAIASVPKLYVQVLHLMNKMNLPAPFGMLTPTPSLPSGVDIQPVEPLKELQENALFPPDNDMEKSSSDESEIESDEDSKVKATQGVSLKRPSTTCSVRVRKKPKLQQLIQPLPKESKASVLKPEEVFEQAELPQNKQLNIKIPTSDSAPVAVPPVPDNLLNLLESMREEDEQKEGFGTFNPVLQEKDDEKNESEGEQEWGESEFLSDRRLRRNRLSEREMKELTVFKNYQPGEPTSRLYIKNVAKHVTEKDLHYVYGRYVNWESEEEKIMFDIRLMKEGRMKGQAFITMPNEQSAKDAVRNTNGYLLEGKPLVVQFARSAKPKEGDDKNKKK